MNAQKTESATPEVQNTLWGGESRRKKLREVHPVSDSLLLDCASPAEPDPGPRPRVDYAGQEIVDALYIAPDLAWVHLTAPRGSLPTTTRETVFSGAHVEERGPELQLLTRELWGEVLAQVEALDLQALPAERREQFAARWEFVRGWAACEGWG